MCVIIFKPVDTVVPLEHLTNAIATNRDGWGYAVRDPQGQIFVHRAMGALSDGIKEVAQDPQLEVTFHARIGTSGTKDLANCHPFPVGDHSWLFHNGILNISRTEDLSLCDTAHFARFLGNAMTEAEMGAAWFDSRLISGLMMLYIGAERSKVVIVSPDRTRIWGHKDGVERDGVWYSNSSAFYSSYVKTSSYADDWDREGGHYGKYRGGLARGTSTGSKTLKRYEDYVEYPAGTTIHGEDGSRYYTGLGFWMDGTFYPKASPGESAGTSENSSHVSEWVDDGTVPPAKQQLALRTLAEALGRDEADDDREDSPLTDDQRRALEGMVRVVELTDAWQLLTIKQVQALPYTNPADVALVLAYEWGEPAEEVMERVVNSPDSVFEEVWQAITDRMQASIA
jgi:predicted glutamine amidotransferase